MSALSDLDAQVDLHHAGQLADADGQRLGKTLDRLGASDLLDLGTHGAPTGESVDLPAPSEASA